MNGTPEGHVDTVANVHAEDHPDPASVPLSQRPPTPHEAYKARGYWRDGRWT